ncbi:MAG: arginine repressor [Lachnospiraceae bacterium]|nr:arginine repressor [Lachnospiraceae bacterium]
MKNSRHQAILKIIEENDVQTQEELANLLNKEGFIVTQATVSRDIKQLRLKKIPSERGQKYSAQELNPSGLDDKYADVLRAGFVSMDTAQNILVIKTVSGMAMAVAAALDALDYKQIVGSIAGDDTIMCAVKSSGACSELMEELNEILK